MSSAVAFRPKEILAVLSEYGAKYIVIGGLGSTIHGAPLQTSDVDICPALATGDLDKLSPALTELDAARMATDEPRGVPLDWTGRLLKKLLPELRFLNLMTKYGQLNLVYRPDGTDGYRDLSRGAETKSLGDGVEIRVAGLQDIIRSKQAAGRPRDLEHLPTLRKLLEIQSEGEEGTP